MKFSFLKSHSTLMRVFQSDESSTWITNDEITSVGKSTEKNRVKVNPSGIITRRVNIAKKKIWKLFSVHKKPISIFSSARITFRVIFFCKLNLIAFVWTSRKLIALFASKSSKLIWPETPCVCSCTRNGDWDDDDLDQPTTIAASIQQHPKLLNFLSSRGSNDC